MLCSICKFANSDSATHCSRCGNPMSLRQSSEPRQTPWSIPLPSSPRGVFSARPSDHVLKYFSDKSPPALFVKRGRHRAVAETPTSQMGHRSNPTFIRSPSNEQACRIHENFLQIADTYRKHSTKDDSCMARTFSDSTQPYLTHEHGSLEPRKEDAEGIITREMSGHYADLVEQIISETISWSGINLSNLPEGLKPYILALSSIQGFTEGLIVFRGLSTDDVNDLETVGDIRSKAERNNITNPAQWRRSAEHVEASQNSPFVSWTHSLQGAAEWARQTVDPSELHYRFAGDAVAIAFISKDSLPSINESSSRNVTLGGIGCTEILTIGSNAARVFATLTKRKGQDKSFDKSNPKHFGIWTLWPLYQEDENEYQKFCSTYTQPEDLDDKRT